MNTINIILSDNQELTAYALRRMLEEQGCATISEAHNKAALIDALAKTPHSVVLIDFSLFDFTDDESMLIVSERYAESRWVLLGDELTDAMLRRMVYGSQAFSIVFKDSSLQEIAEAVAAATNGRRYLSPRATEILISHQNDDTPSHLTTTEIEIAKAIAQGKTTKEIAAERCSSIHTITTHRKNIFRKLGVNTAHEVMRYALRAGWVDSAEFYI